MAGHPEWSEDATKGPDSILNILAPNDQSTQLV